MNIRCVFRFACICALMSGVFFTSCKNDDTLAEELTQKYLVKLSVCQPYSADRLCAGDSLTERILDEMGYAEDENHFISVTGSDLEGCDSKVKKAFEDAVHGIDPEEYGGRYAVSVYRPRGNDEQPLIVATKEFVAAADNKMNGFSYDKWTDLGKNEYFYDLAVAADEHSSDALKALNNAGFTCFTGDCNAGAGGKYIYVGYKKAAADFVTDITGPEYDDFGDPTGGTRQLTAKEAAISYLLVSYGGSFPTSFYGPELAQKDLSEYVFERPKHLGESSNGDLTQGSGGDYIYLWFSRTNNSQEYVSGLGSDDQCSINFWSGEDSSGSFVKAVNLYSLPSDLSSSPFAKMYEMLGFICDGKWHSTLASDYADANYDHGGHYVYFGFEIKSVSKN